MEFRIRDFNDVFRERLLVRLSGVGPDQDPDEYREMLGWVLRPPPLVRQTNRHHLLPTAKLEQFWTGTGQEREEIMAEFEAGEAAAERSRAMRKAAEEIVQARRDAGFTGSFTVDDCLATLEWEARGEAAEAAEDARRGAAWAATWSVAETEYQDELPEDDEERDAGTTVYQDDPLDYDDDAGEVYDTHLLE